MIKFESDADPSGWGCSESTRRTEKEDIVSGRSFESLRNSLTPRCSAKLPGLFLAYVLRDLYGCVRTREKYEIRTCLHIE